jgi:hypothetical protein
MAKVSKNHMGYGNQVYGNGSWIAVDREFLEIFYRMVRVSFFLSEIFLLCKFFP